MRKTAFIYSAAILFAALGITFCSDFTSGPPGGGGNGTGYVTISIGGAGAAGNARTLIPSGGGALPFTAYELLFENEEGDSKELTIETAADIANPITLKTGNWLLVLKAYIGEIAEENVAAEGSSDWFEISDGGEATVSLELEFVEEAGTGTLSYAIVNESGITLDAAKITLERFGGDGEDDDIEIDLKAEGYTGTKADVAVGYYLASVILETQVGGKVEKKAVYSDILHIYGDRTTELARTFGAGNFYRAIEDAWIVIGEAGLPGTAMTKNADGTFIWSGDLAADALVKFRLTNSATAAAGDWFVPETDNTDASGDGAYEAVFVEREAADKEWKFSVAGHYIIILNPLALTVNVTPWPVLQSAVINIDAPASLVLTFNTAVAAASSAGFSISGSDTAAGFANDISGSGTEALTLTLNRPPAYGETLVLAYDADTGNVKHAKAADAALESFDSQEVTLDGFTEENAGRPTVQTVEIDAKRSDEEASEAEAKVIYVTFNKAVTSGSAGFTVSGSKTAEYVTGVVAVAENKVLKLTLNDWPSKSEGTGENPFTLHYNMSLGNAQDADGGPVLSFERAVTLTNFDTLGGSGENTDTTPPRMISATVENATPSTVRVVFNEPVTLDTSKFLVKVNDVPFTKMSATPPASGILLDLQKRTDRTISAASAVDGEETTWDLTMSAPAVHGEILRLATSGAGAAQDKADEPNSLPAIPQFIVNNKVKRVRGSFESVAGLYVDGTKVESVTDGDGGKLYENAIKYLHTANNVPPANKVTTIVLDTNQIFSSAPSWWSTGTSNVQIPEDQANQQPRKIVVTTTGGTHTISNQQTGTMFQGRNGIILVIDEGVIFQGSTSYPLKAALIQMMSGGSIILDGGEIRNNVSAKDGGSGQTNDLHAGAIRFGGGANGGYLIINSGKITGNTAKVNTGTIDNGNGAAGAIVVQQYGVIVMNGGEISNNTLDVQGRTTLASAAAGAIMGSNNTAQWHGNASFFMTGGEIYGNKIINGGSVANASAGGVFISGTFQKNGGTIYGSTGEADKINTTSLTGNKAGAVFVAGGTGANPAATAKVGSKEAGETTPSKRNDTTGLEAPLFLESFKSGTSATAVNYIPDWATSFWDTTN